MGILTTYYSNIWCIRLQNIQVFRSSFFITIDNGNFSKLFCNSYIQKTNSWIDSFNFYLYRYHLFLVSVCHQRYWSLQLSMVIYKVALYLQLVQKMYFLLPLWQIKLVLLLYPRFLLAFSKNKYNNTRFYNKEFLRVVLKLMSQREKCKEKTVASCHSANSRLRTTHSGLKRPKS